MKKETQANSIVDAMNQLQDLREKIKLLIDFTGKVVHNDVSHLEIEWEESDVSYPPPHMIPLFEGEFNPALGQIVPSKSRKMIGYQKIYPANADMTQINRLQLFLPQDIVLKSMDHILKLMKEKQQKLENLIDQQLRDKKAPGNT